MARLTQRKALHYIRTVLGLTANIVGGEYRIDYRQHDPRYQPEPKNPSKPSKESLGTKYYTDDPADAVATAEVMSKVRSTEGGISSRRQEGGSDATQ